MTPNIVEHLTAFVAVIENGGFTAAARKLNRAVSSVSYSIAQIEAHCGFPLLHRAGRRPELTERGRALYAEARAVIDSASRFSMHARGLVSGEETRLRILVDVLFPRDLLTRTLSEFARTHPRTRVQLYTASLATLWDDLRTGLFDFALSLYSAVPSGMRGTHLGEIRLRPYCAATHRLAKLRGPLDAAAFVGERQLYFVGGPEIDTERVGRTFSTDLWTTNDIELVRILVCSGLGWCFGTDSILADELASGRMVGLECTDARFHPLRSMGIVWSKDRPPGILGQEMIRLVERGA
jgi:DNA-binding transcriptional LysR family regulator